MAEGAGPSYSLQRSIPMRDMFVGIGATLVFFAVMMLMPMLGALASVAAPLPTLVNFYRWGRPAGYWVPALSLGFSALALAAFGLLQSLVYLTELLLLGLLVAEGMRRRWTPAMIVGCAAGLVFALAAVLFWLGHGGFSGSVFGGLEAEVRLVLTTFLEHYGSDPGEAAAIREGIEPLVPLVVRLLPGMGAASVLLIAWLNLLMARRFCRLQGIALPPWPAWNRWKSPEGLVWLLIAAGFLALMGGVPRLLGFNALIVVGVVYLLQGVAIVAFYFDRWHVPGLVRGFGYGFIFLQQLATLLIMLLGLFDLWLDFRRLAREPANDPS